MTEISPSGAALFFAAVALVFLGILISMVELIAAWRFARWAFRVGPRVLRLQMVLPRPVRSPASDEPGTTPTGRYKLVSTGSACSGLDSSCLAVACARPSHKGRYSLARF